MARSCAAPRSVGVQGYSRTGPRRKAKAPASYWECFRNGRGCGTHHRNQSSALRHARQLDRIVRRQARKKGQRLVLWEPEKRGT